MGARSVTALAGCAALAAVSACRDHAPGAYPIASAREHTVPPAVSAAPAGSDATAPGSASAGPAPSASAAPGPSDEAIRQLMACEKPGAVLLDRPAAGMVFNNAMTTKDA